MRDNRFPDRSLTKHTETCDNCYEEISWVPGRESKPDRCHHCGEPLDPVE